MGKSSIRIEYRRTKELDDVSSHGLLATAYQFAQRKGFFEHWDELPVKMKSVVYSPADKLKTLWASIIVGCEHTVDINSELGAHEHALAAIFGLNRFPDQSQVNRVLSRVTEQTVSRYRDLHFELLCRHTQCRRRKLWTRFGNWKRYLVADLDQRALTVSGKQFELARKGHFGRHRGHAGYQLSALFLGGEIGEVVEEYFDPGNTQAKERVADLLARLARFCQRVGIEPQAVMLRGDAQFGTPANIAQVESYGFKYLFRGLCTQKANKLAGEVEDYFLRLKPGAEDQARWMADLGERIHLDQSQEARGKKQIRCRTLVLSSVRKAPATNPNHHGKKRLTKEETREKVSYGYFLTNLTPEELPLERVLEIYDDRVTIERYFCDEQNALGAANVRTGRYHGEALFQFMVATTNNLLRWFRAEILKGTAFENYGLKRIIKNLMGIPAILKRVGSKWVMKISHLHAEGRKLLTLWQPAQIPYSP
jgi:hypothetical protein